MNIIIAQAVGFVGLTLAIISFQQNTNKGILFYQLLAALTFTLHFSLLGAFSDAAAYTGAALNLVGATKNIVFYNREKNWANKKWWLYLFIALYIVVGLLTWKSLFSVLPIIGMTFATVATWIKNPKYTRLIMLPGSPCWLVYNLVNYSIAGVITEIFVSSSIIIAMFRFDYFQKKKTIELNKQEV